MSIEDRLRDSLRRRAGSVRPRPDLDDVVARTTQREHRTRRLLVAGLVVALIAGPLAGFALGRADDSGGSDVATGGGGGREAVGGAADAAMSAALPTDQPLEKLFFRTTADGVVIRAYRSEGIALPPAPGCPPGAECAPAAECAAGPMITGELSTDEAVTVASAGAGQASDDDLFVATAQWSTFGIAEGAPTRWVIASVSPSVARVRVAFAGGATDEMEPVDGIVILAGRVADADGGSGTLEALAGDGSVLHRLDIVPGAGAVANSSGSSGSSESGAKSSAELRTEASASGSGSSANARASVSSSGSAGIAASCVGPVPAPAPAPTLPPPGEQPADPASARTEIEQAFAMSFDGSISAEESALYEEGPGVSPEEVARSCDAAQATHTTAKVTDVVFTSATEAFVRYDISIDNSPNQFPGQGGTALLIEGRWKVSHQTACAAAAIGG